ncbi:MAG: haloalkane dehalogenase [Pseudomonadota bacterium]
MSDWAAQKHHTDVLGLRMAHVEMGQGDPILFLHGNPTSSFLWREVMAAMDGLGRLIAPDLIGCGDSDKLPDSGPGRYTIAEHARYLDAWIDAQIPTGIVTLVIHDWGGALGFDWARRNADRVRAIAYMETIVRPMDFDTEWPEAARGIFGGLRSEAGEDMILQKNVFVERILPGSILRTLSDAEMAEYRRPFVNPGEDRRPTLTFPRQIPLSGEPADVVEMAQAYFDWLSASMVPKFFVNADPGAILIGPMRESCRAFPNQQEITVAGSHFIQEDSGNEIGTAIKDWLVSSVS